MCRGGVQFKVQQLQKISAYIPFYDARHSVFKKQSIEYLGCFLQSLRIGREGPPRTVLMIPDYLKSVEYSRS